MKEPDPNCPICHGTGRIEGTESQIGLESTPEEYIRKMTEVFHEVRRVLRADGTCWINMGDCYAGGSKHASKILGRKDTDRMYPGDPEGLRGDDFIQFDDGLKDKDLIGQPWRLAFALQADGWYLRSDIIWAKPNPMPESVNDRPTKAHEYIFLLSKSPRYFYDKEAVKERQSPNTHKRAAKGKRASMAYKMDAAGIGNRNNPSFQSYMQDLPPDSGRNARTVWEIATQPYPDAHFATFPEELPRRCIKAGCPPKGIVLDPFAGSGTTGAVARSLGRSCVLIELNPEYVRLIEERTDAKVPALTEFEEAYTL